MAAHALVPGVSLSFPGVNLRSACALACALALPMALATAQDTTSASQKVGPDRLLQLSFGGGFAKVSSTPLSQTTNGFTLQAGLGVRTPVPSLRLRFDGLFSDAGTTQVKAFTAGALLSAPSRWKASPYFLAGGGGYIDSGARMTAGWNLGLGVNVRAGDQILFMESRAHWYRDAFAGEPYRVPFGVVVDRHEPYKYVLQPLTFGFRF